MSSYIKKIINIADNWVKDTKRWFIEAWTFPAVFLYWTANVSLIFKKSQNWHVYNWTPNFLSQICFAPTIVLCIGIPSHLEKMLRFLYWTPIPTWCGYYCFSDFRTTMALVHLTLTRLATLLFLKHTGQTFAQDFAFSFPFFWISPSIFKSMCSFNHQFLPVLNVTFRVGPSYLNYKPSFLNPYFIFLHNNDHHLTIYTFCLSLSILWLTK